MNKVCCICSAPALVVSDSGKCYCNDHTSWQFSQLNKPQAERIAALEAQIAGNAKLFAKMVEDLARVEADAKTAIAAAVAAEREACAETRPRRAAGNPPNGEWGGHYQCGWDHAVIAYDAAIRARGSKRADKGV